MPAGTARVTSSASGTAPEAARSLRLTAAARNPSSRQPSQSKRKWTPSTSASWVTTRSGVELRRVVLDADDQPVPLELREEPELTALREPRQPPSSRSDRRPRGSWPRPQHRRRCTSPAFDASMPPIATTGTAAIGADRAEPVEADRRRGVHLRRCLPDRPGAEIVGVRGAGFVERGHRAAEQETAERGRCSAPGSPWPR